MNAAAQELIQRATREFLQEYRPDELPMFGVFWAAAKDYLDDLDQGEARRNLIGPLIGAVGGAQRSIDDWASPFVLLLLNALLSAQPLGKLIPPTLPEIRELFRTVATKHHAPKLLAEQLAPIAERLYYGLSVGSRPTYRIENYYRRIDLTDDGPISLDAGDRLFSEASSRKPSDQVGYDVVVRVEGDESSVTKVRGQTTELAVRQTRFLVYVLVARGITAPYWDLDSAVEEMSLHVMPTLGVAVSRDGSSPTKLLLREARGRMHKLRQRLKLAPWLDDRINPRGGGYIVEPDVRFCVLIRAIHACASPVS